MGVLHGRRIPTIARTEGGPVIEVYARRANSPRAAALVAKLRAAGENAREGNSAYFDPDQVDRSAVKVYHDGEDQRIPNRYADLGIPCELIPGMEPETSPRADPEDGAGKWRVEQAGTWHTLYDPEGNKVGKAQRSEAKAWTQREGVD